MARNGMLNKIIDHLGFLRFLLALIILLLVLAAPFSGTSAQYSGWGLYPSVIAPALVPMFLFIMPLDMTMCAIYMSGKDGAGRRRYRSIIWIDLALLSILILVWIPFFLRLLRG